MGLEHGEDISRVDNLVSWQIAEEEGEWESVDRYEGSLRFERQTYYGLQRCGGEEGLGPWPGDEVETTALHVGALCCCRREALSRKITSLETIAVVEPVEGCWVGGEEGPPGIYAWSQSGQIWIDSCGEESMESRTLIVGGGGDGRLSTTMAAVDRDWDSRCRRRMAACSS